MCVCEREGERERGWGPGGGRGVETGIRVLDFGFSHVLKSLPHTSTEFFTAEDLQLACWLSAKARRLHTMFENKRIK